MAHDTDEKKSENVRESGEQKESEAEDKLDEQVGDSGEEEKDSEEEGDFESEVPSEEESGEKKIEETWPLLTPFTGDEKISSDEDDLPLSEVGKKRKKAPVKATKSVILTKKEVAPPARTPLTRSKRKAVDKQIIKESIGAKKPRKQVLVVEHVVELDKEDESDSTLQEKTSTQKRNVVKSTREATPSKKASKGKKKKGMHVVVDNLIEIRNRKVLNGKIIANSDEKGMA
nr:46 kDa FK506-binding nuclear protein-like [Nicotiana tomentosiformis]